MHVKEARITDFRRFTDLSITNLPESIRLVVLAGPNGNGKSSLFDAFKQWINPWIGGYPHDPAYNWRKDTEGSVSVDFHRPLSNDRTLMRNLFYARSAYRNEPDFQVDGLRPVGSALDAPKASRMIEQDSTVKDNHQRLVSIMNGNLFDGIYNTMSGEAIVESVIGEVRDSMLRIFPNLRLTSVGKPLVDGSFYFTKGTSANFHYKNLSGGEKAVFDILLDLIVKRGEYNDTVYCIDEPETHMNTRIQGKLLDELLALIPENSQLWIASHSIGMLRRAKDIQTEHPGTVAFLDFEQDFDQPVILQPTVLDRNYWKRTLHVALDDLASLVAPSQLVLCEGRALGPRSSPAAEFDSTCYRTIF